VQIAEACPNYLMQKERSKQILTKQQDQEN
jgi:hypothetical protein